MKKFLSRGKIGIIILVVISLSILSGYLYLFFPGTANNNQKNIRIVIDEGMSASEIGKELHEKGVISREIAFLIMGKLYRYDTKIHPGIFYLSQDMKVSSVWNILMHGENELIVKVTIPEGYTVNQIAQLLEDKNLISAEKFKEAAKKYAPYDYMKPALDNPDVKYAAEGFLFPDTYEISKESTAVEILKIMVDNFNKKFDSSRRKLASEENLTIYEVVTLASIVEKESKLSEDRPIIAQVFFSRLKINMPLQSDATIQYASDKHIEDFTIAHTKMDTPYNTYLHYGLTPGPIANPGLDSIDAVLHKANTDYLYFVADKEGKNHYAKTYAEHENNIKKIYGDS